MKVNKVGWVVIIACLLAITLALLVVASSVVLSPVEDGSFGMVTKPVATNYQSDLCKNSAISYSKDLNIIVDGYEIIGEDLEVVFHRQPSVSTVNDSMRLSGAVLMRSKVGNSVLMPYYCDMEADIDKKPLISRALDKELKILDEDDLREFAHKHITDPDEWRVVVGEPKKF